MNVKNNKRRQNSRRKIQEALLFFLESKELHQVRVSEICERAKINRTTFYANFNDIYDLADSIRKQLEQEVDSFFSLQPDKILMPDDFLRLFQHISENRLFYRIYFKLGYDSSDNLGFLGSCRLPEEITVQHLDYHAEFFKSGLNTIVKKWLSENCCKTPQEMCSILLAEYKGRFSDK
ncbi:MAG: TetR/AcrR family transcriptional regulator [Ruminococcus sp.]|nr:TetR/AcrR family transcriptional regulator [Ruminococcus sp.]